MFWNTWIQICRSRWGWTNDGGSSTSMTAGAFPSLACLSCSLSQSLPRFWFLSYPFVCLHNRQPLSHSPFLLLSPSLSISPGLHFTLSLFSKVLPCHSLLSSHLAVWFFFLRRYSPLQKLPFFCVSLYPLPFSQPLSFALSFSLLSFP